MQQNAGLEIDNDARLPPGAAVLLFLVLALLTWAAVFLAAWALWQIL